MTHALFDRVLARRRLARAAANPVAGADFLAERAADDLAERLAALKRRFVTAVDLATPTPAFRRTLEAWGGANRVFRAAPLAGLPQDRAEMVADAEIQPFAAESIDLIVSGLVLHMVDDLPGALVQLRRALKPDGLLLAALVGGATLVELREAFASAEIECEGGLSPRVAPFIDVRDLGGLLQRAGFALPVTDLETVTVRYTDVFGLLHDLRAMGATNTLLERRRRPLRRGTLLRMAELYAERFGGADGRVKATFQIAWASGWAPHASQPQALRPGSAKARLADALGSEERSAGEKAGRG